MKHVESHLLLEMLIFWFEFGILILQPYSFHGHDDQPAEHIPAASFVLVVLIQIFSQHLCVGGCLDGEIDNSLNNDFEKLHYLSMGRDINGINLKWSFIQTDAGHLFTVSPLVCDDKGEDKDQAMELHVSNYERSELASRFK